MANEKIRILLVEDDLALRDIYQSRLGAEGFEVVIAANGEDALARAVSEHPSLILLDLMMPEINGFDVLDILKKTAATKDTKVIILSALSDPESVQRATSLGADAYLVKAQASLNEVIGKVHELLEA